MHPPTHRPNAQSIPYFCTHTDHTCMMLAKYAVGKVCKRPRCRTSFDARVAEWKTLSQRCNRTPPDNVYGNERGRTHTQVTWAFSTWLTGKEGNSRGANLPETGPTVLAPSGTPALQNHGIVSHGSGSPPAVGGGVNNY